MFIQFGMLTAAVLKEAATVSGDVATVSSNTAQGGVPMVGSIVFYLVIMVAFIYFFMIRPQKKEQKKANEMLSTLETGDVVLTTSGFYGVVIDITEEDVIVEFGSNKNCRIPMRKTAIANIEKAE